MGELNKLPNIGKNLEEKLNDVDIFTRDELLSLGSKVAFMKIRKIDNGACLNMLYALEGAVQGIRWHYLSKETKNDLKIFINSVSDTEDQSCIDTDCRQSLPSCVDIF